MTSWMHTYTGRQVFPLSPTSEDIDIQDIARSLSMQCRYLGHTLEFYSVAEHCVHIAKRVPPEHGLAGLLHDASEAYMGDIPRPLKPFIPGYRQIEDRLMLVIAQKFGFSYPLPASVKEADLRILVNERSAVLAKTDHHWASLEGVKHLPNTVIQCWTPQQAYLEFMLLFEKLTQG